MSKAILICFHKYTPFGGEFYEPLLDFQLKTLEKYQNEFDRVYLIDSNWNIDFVKVIKKLPAPKFKIIKVNPSLRYYDAYKEVLSQVTEDLVLFMDNDMVVYRKDIFNKTFSLLNNYDVVTIMDTIGTFTTDKLKTGNKFCPYWFATHKSLLEKYLNVNWGPDMPYCETLGHLTEKMLADNVNVFEMEDDKTEQLKDLGYYHVRAGGTVAYLLASKHNGHEADYRTYIKNQPHSELKRHCRWYEYMGGNPTEIRQDL